MKRTKKLGIMLGVLAVICVMTLAVSTVKEKQENIEISGETVLSIPVEQVRSFSWEEDGDSLSFHKEEDRWVYDGDEHFPADTDKVENLLRQFEAFGVGFTIEDVEDPGTYGLAEPEDTLTIETEEKMYQIDMGDYSKMDQQRYVSIGDGKVYLAAHDPCADFSDTTLRELALLDEVPDFKEGVQKLHFSGTETYEITRQEKSDSYREDDLWYTERDGEKIPMNPVMVEDYLAQLNNGILYNYADYYATEEELPGYGLDSPELTVEVTYSREEQEQTFTLQIGRNPDEVEKWNALTEEERETADPVPAFVRVEGSDMVYRLDSTDYDRLIRYTVDDLRHKEVIPADAETMKQVDFTIDGTTCHLTAGKEDGVWYHGEDKVEGSDLSGALSDLRITEFKADQPTDKLEISFTAVLKMEGEPKITVELYRYDGTSCLAVVDGKPLGLVSRENTVNLMEAVNSIILKK